MTKQELYQSGVRFIIIAIFIFGGSLMVAFVAYKILSRSMIIELIMLFMGMMSVLLSSVFFIKGMALLITGLFRNANYVPSKPMSQEEMLKLSGNMGAVDGAEGTGKKVIRFSKTFKLTTKDKK